MSYSGDEIRRRPLQGRLDEQVFERIRIVDEAVVGGVLLDVERAITLREAVLPGVLATHRLLVFDVVDSVASMPRGTFMLLL